MIEIGIPRLPSELDPVNLVFVTHFLLLQCSAQTLVRISEEGNIVSDLAEKWIIKEDGTLYEFHLSKKAKFSNGKMVTSSSVAYSLSRHFWNNSVVASYLSSIIAGAEHVIEKTVPEGIKIISDNIIQIKLNKAYPAFLLVLAMPGFSVVSKDDHGMSGPMIPQYKDNKWELLTNKNYNGTSNLKSIMASEVSTVKEALALFKEGDLDLVLGLPLTELDRIKLPKDLKITKTESLVFAHFYYNNKKKFFKELNFREDFSRLIQLISQKKENILEFQTISPYFIPRGIMPLDYYLREKKKTSLDQFKRKWGHYTQGKILKVVLMKKLFKKKLLDDLKKTFSALGISVNLKTVDGKGLVKHMKLNDYDIIGGGYLGNFSDPDGFLDVIKDTSPLNYGVIPTKDLFRKINWARYIKNQKERISQYSQILKDFESQWYFVPLYRIRLPILHNKKLKIPETNFRYESELWKIFWEIENEK